MTKKNKLLRACRAMLIPSGEKVLLAEGTEFSITHMLGGNLTVSGIFGVARIESADAGAFEIPISGDEGNFCKTHSVAEKNSENKDFDEPTEGELWELAKTVFDPEIPVNIVDLGLVYRLELKKGDDGKFRVEADMTLTAPGCVMGPVIADDLKMRMESLPNIVEASVNIVWDPPWNQDMMNENARMTLGLV